MEVFPTCSVEQAQWVLAKARGDLEEAVQMLVEGKEEGPPGWDGSNQVSSPSPSMPSDLSSMCFLVQHTPTYPHLFPLLLPLGLQ